MANGENSAFDKRRVVDRSRIVSLDYYRKHRKIRYLNPDGSFVDGGDDGTAQSKAEHPAGKAKKYKKEIKPYDELPFDQYEGQQPNSDYDNSPEFPWGNVLETGEDETMPHGIMRPEGASDEPREYPKPDWGKNAPKNPPNKKGYPPAPPPKNGWGDGKGPKK